MKQKIKSNLFFIIFLVLMIIPKTRVLLQTQMQKAVGYFNQPSIENTIDTVTFKGRLQGINTKNVDISSLNNKVVIINYWATWCPPCVAEMPSFQALYETYKNNDDVAFLFLTDDNQHKVNTFLEARKFTLPVYVENGSSFPNLNPKSIPTTYITNRKGEIKVKKTGAVQWNSQKVHNIINELLK